MEFGLQSEVIGRNLLLEYMGKDGVKFDYSEHKCYLVESKTAGQILSSNDGFLKMTQHPNLAPIPELQEAFDYCMNRNIPLEIKSSRDFKIGEKSPLLYNLPQMLLEALAADTKYFYHLSYTPELSRFFILRYDHDTAMAILNYVRTCRLFHYKKVSQETLLAEAKMCRELVFQYAKRSIAFSRAFPFKGSTHLAHDCGGACTVRPPYYPSQQKAFKRKHE